MIRRFLFALALVAAVGVFAPVSSEEVPPISIGSGQSATQSANGQVVEISVQGPIQVTVYFESFEPGRIAGLATRTSGGSSSGTITILWVNQNVQQVISLSAGNPDELFSLEGGDGDKRSQELQ